MRNISGTKIFCMALATLMFSLILIPAGSAAIGVEEGDWAKYSFEAEIPEMMEEVMEEIEEWGWMKFEVQSISDTTVTLEGTVHYKNGTEETGETMDGIESGLIIEANLTEGDEVIAPFFGFFWAGVPMYINGTISRKYAGARREVNYIHMEMEDGGSLDMKAYWDKAKGVLCEMSMSASGIGYTMSISVELTETNMWEAEAEAESAPFITQWWFWTIIAVIIIVAAGSAVLLWRRRKPPLPETAPAPTEQSKSMTRLG